MKKAILFLIGILSIVFFASCQKTEPAELVIINENNQEEILQITKTENKDDLVTLVNNLKKAKLDPISFSSMSVVLNSQVEGKLSVGENEITKVELKYDIHMDSIIHIKKYLLSGNLALEGYTKTDSSNLFINSKQKLLASFTNDDENLYVNYSFDSDGIQIKDKNKMDISSFTEEYKTQIVTSLDVLKYYNPITLFPKMEAYLTAISDTKKDSFTLKFSFPVEEKSIDCYVELSCQTLLPIQMHLDLDELLLQELEEEYIDKYIGEPVKVENAVFTLELKIEYGNHSVSTLTEEEKSKYTYFN